MSAAPQTWDVRARFVALTAPFQGRAFPIVLFPAMIGRGPECAVFLDAASISRQHAVVEEQDGRFRVRDLGSRNGIQIGGQVVREADLNAGDVLSVGDIQLRFEPAPAGKPAVAEAQPPAPVDAAARNVSGKDILTLTQTRPEAVAGASPGGAESQPRVGLNMKMIVAIILALVLSLGVGAVVVARLGAAKKVRHAEWLTLQVKIGERKWVRISQLAYLTIEKNTSLSRVDLRGNDIFDQIPVDDDQIATVEKYDFGEILITGKSVGDTSATITMAETGSQISLRILVRGRMEDPLEPLIYGRFNPDERTTMAQQFVENGRQIEKERPYLALQEYQKAIAVLDPLPHRTGLYLAAVQRLTAMRDLVDKTWESLRKDISIAGGSHDEKRQMDLLQDALKLIPDPNDPRHQKAQGTIQSLIRRQLEEKEGR